MIDKKRHTCIVCGKKRYERFMRKTEVMNDYLHWACSLTHCKNNAWELVTYQTCHDKLSDLDGQLKALREKELFRKMFHSTTTKELSSDKFKLFIA